VSGLVERLLAAPEGVNPAVGMSQRLKEMARAGELDPEIVGKLLPKINRAIETGDRDLHAASEAFSDLRDAGAVASREVPFGF
jgi:hypothetical protein